MVHQLHNPLSLLTQPSFKDLNTQSEILQAKTISEQVPKRQRTEHEKRPRSVDTEEDDTTSEVQLQGPKNDQPNPRQASLDPSMTHSNHMMVASVLEYATTSTVARVEARVTETEE